jgi:uncharacterized protein YegJ (DUF2314 family)
MCFRVAFLIVVCVNVLSCSRTGRSAQLPKEQPFTAGPPMADFIRFEYSVYLLPGHSTGKQSLDVCHQLLRTQYNALRIVTPIPEHPAHLQHPLIDPQLADDVQKNYAPPTIESLKYRGVGLSSGQEKQLQKSREAIILQFGHSREHVWSSLLLATRLAEDLARKTGGLIFDQETRQVFTPEAWHKRRLDSWTGNVPELGRHFTIDLYQADEYERAITLGMAKFGLPDVVVQQLPQSSSGDVGDLINIFAQSMAEGAVVPSSGKFKIDVHSIGNEQLRNSELKSLKPHALGTACLFLKPGKREEGDPDNRLVELTAGLYSGADSLSRQDNMLSSLFGWEDVAHDVEHTPELLAESQRERAKLPVLHKDFQAGLKPGEYILVKAPFTFPDGREWMWVEITRWSGNTIKGTLQNEPVDVPNLHVGQVVEVREDDVFDYIRYYPDKHTEGNTTGKILERLESQPRSAPDHSEMPKCDPQ